jgi:predicted DNA-binding transcriptional regulator YafY
MTKRKNDMAKMSLEARFKKLKERKGVKKQLKQYDSKIFRLMYILNKLDAGSQIATQDLAKEFNVSPRTVQRDIQLIDIAQFPLTTMEKGQYSFQKGFSLKKMMLTHEQASLLAFLGEIAQSLGMKFEESFKGIVNKVISPECDLPYYAKIPEGVKLKKYSFLKDIETGIAEFRRVELYYLMEGKEKWLKVDPLKIAFFDGFWYLVSRVGGKDWILKLRLDRIKNLTLTKEHFKIPSTLKAMLEQSVNVWFSEKRNKKITLKVDGEVAHFFKQKKYFPMQKIKKVQKNGSLIIECKACQYEEVIPTIMHWIPHIVVVEPKSLRKEIEKIVGDYGKKIKNGTA